MENIAVWCKAVAVISVFSAVLLSVIPESKIKGAFKALTSIILVYAFLSPLINNQLDFSSVEGIFDFESGDEMSENYEDYQYYPLITAGKSEYERYINELIAKIGKDGRSEVTCSYKDEKLSVDEIIIFGYFNESETEYLKSEIVKITSDTANITFKGDVNGQ